MKNIICIRKGEIKKNEATNFINKVIKLLDEEPQTQKRIISELAETLNA